MISAVAGIPLDANTNNLGLKFSQIAEEDREDLFKIALLYRQSQPQVYTVDIDPYHLLGTEAVLRAKVEAIPTTWTLSHQQLRTIQTAVHALLADDPGFQALIAGQNAPGQ